jgi:hypothetical protein
MTSHDSTLRFASALALRFRSVRVVCRKRARTV